MSKSEWMNIACTTMYGKEYSQFLDDIGYDESEAAYDEHMRRVEDWWNLNRAIDKDWEDLNEYEVEQAKRDYATYLENRRQETLYDYGLSYADFM